MVGSCGGGHFRKDWVVRMILPRWIPFQNFGSVTCEVTAKWRSCLSCSHVGALETVQCIVSAPMGKNGGTLAQVDSCRRARDSSRRIFMFSGSSWDASAATV